MDPQPGFFCQTSCIFRGHLSRSVLTICEQHQYFFVIWKFFHSFYGQSDCIPNCSSLSGESQLRLFKHLPQRLSIESQWCLQISLVSEQNQPQAITFSPFNKGSQYRFNYSKTRHSLSLQFQISFFHASRKIYCKHHTSSRNG